MPRAISSGIRDSQRRKNAPAPVFPSIEMRSMRPVPLSWLSSACSPATTCGWSVANDPDPLKPCSSPFQWPARIVRFGFGYTAFRIRIASIITTVPLPLSVAPDAGSHESRCAESTTYSLGFSLPRSSAITFAAGTWPRSDDCASTRSIGPWLRSARRYTSP